MQKNCVKCGLPFDCKENESCWCFEEARLAKTDIKFDGCVCKKCLLLQYREKLGV